MREENKEEKKEESSLKTNFFQKIWNSIIKVEKYPDMAAEGLGKAIGYLAKIVTIFAIVICLGMVYQTHTILQEGISYLEKEFPEFSYKEGKLNVESEEKIIISEHDSYVGKTIIDTKTEDESTINQYINEITELGEGLIVLKDKIIIKNSAISGTIGYTYQETFEPIGLEEFSKQNVIEYANSNKIVTLYVSLFLTIFIYVFTMYLLTILSDAVILSFFGYITTVLAKIKMRYVAIFNMSVYALTLSIILNMLYVAVNIFIPFNMEYFQVMYVAVATIYLIAAVLILKTDFMKRQMELMKIAEVQQIVRQEMEQKEQEEKDKKEQEEQRKKDKKKEEEDKKDNDEAPEGSNA